MKQYQSASHQHSNKDPQAPSCPYPDEVLSGHELEAVILAAAIKKANAPFDKTFFLGALAGIWVGLAGIAALTVAGGIPVEVRNEWPMLPKLCMGIFFTFALHFIVMFGGDLFTGSMMTLTIGVLNGAVPLRKVWINFLAVYLGNWSGCLLAAYFLALRTELFDAEPFHSYVSSYAIPKITGHTWGTLFLKAIPANTLVGMAVVLGAASRDAAGRIMALYFPVLLFVISGWEHCVANMFFISTSLMYGAPSTIARFWYNQSAAIVGNYVGGGILIAGSLHALNHWKSIFTLVPGMPEFLVGSNAYAHQLDEKEREKTTQDLESVSVGNRDDDSYAHTSSIVKTESTVPVEHTVVQVQTHDSEESQPSVCDGYRGF